MLKLVYEHFKTAVQIISEDLKENSHNINIGNLNREMKAIKKNK